MPSLFTVKHLSSVDSVVAEAKRLVRAGAELIKPFHDFNTRIGMEICDYVLGEMTHDSGAFFSTTDADSEGMEGKFFLWSNDEVIDELGNKDGELFCKIFDIHAKPIGDAGECIKEAIDEQRVRSGITQRHS